MMMYLVHVSLPFLPLFVEMVAHMCAQSLNHRIDQAFSIFLVHVEKHGRPVYEAKYFEAPLIAIFSPVVPWVNCLMWLIYMYVYLCSLLFRHYNPFCFMYIERFLISLDDVVLLSSITPWYVHHHDKVAWSDSNRDGLASYPISAQLFIVTYTL